MQNKSLFPILLTVFIDMLGVGIVIPVFAPLFLDINSAIFTGEVSLNTRTLLLGILISVYPMAQFFGAPILGQYSDKYGRKPMLLISLGGTLFGYILTAYAIITGNLLLLFAGRAIDGFTGGNISIALSSIADISEPKTKAKNFGLVGAIFGLGFILGPFFGGILSDAQNIEWFNYATPFIFAAILAGINIIVLQLLYVETLPEKIHSKITFFSGIINVKKAMRKENLRILFLVSFLMMLGFSFFAQFFQVYLIETFDYTQSQIGFLFAYVGIWIIITQGIILRKISSKYSPVQILKYTILFLAISFPVLLIPNKAQLLYLVVPFIPIFNGLSNPNITALISNNAKATEQGEIMGINQSLNALGHAVPPIISGILVSIYSGLPVITASAIIFLAWIVFKQLHVKNSVV